MANFLNRVAIAALAACVPLAAGLAGTVQNETPAAKQPTKGELSAADMSVFYLIDGLTREAAAKHLDELRASIETTRQHLVQAYGNDPVRYSQARATLCLVLLKAMPGLGFEEYESLDSDPAASDGASLNGCRLIVANEYMLTGRIGPCQRAFQKVADDSKAPADYLGYAKFMLASTGALPKAPGEPFATLDATIPAVERTRDARFAALYKTLVKVTSNEEKIVSQAIVDAYAVLIKSPDPDPGTQVGDLTWAAAALQHAGELEKALDAATRAEALAKQLPQNDPRIRIARGVRAKLLKARHADEELKAYADVDPDHEYSMDLGMAIAWKCSVGFEADADVVMTAQVQERRRR